MKNLIDECHLIQYPGVIREIYQKDRQITIEFIFWSDNDSCYTYSKDYESQESLKKSISKFIEVHKTEVDSMDSEEVLANIENIKKLFIQDIIDDKVTLPDQGRGYVFEGDKQYLRVMLTW